MRLYNPFSSHGGDRGRVDGVSVSPEGDQDSVAGVNVEETEILDTEPCSSHVEDVEVPELLVMQADIEDDEDDEIDVDESPALWIMQRDGTMVRNPEGDIWVEEHANDGSAPRRRWSSVDVDKAPAALNPPPSLCPRPRSSSFSEGTHRVQLPEVPVLPSEL